MERLTPGLLRSRLPRPPGLVIPREFGEPVPPGVLEMLVPLLPVGEGVRRLVVPDWPGVREMLAPRSSVEADGERPADEPEGVREIEDGDRPAADGVRLMFEPESREIEPLGARAAEPDLLASPAERLTDGPAERPASPAPDRAEPADGDREIDGVRSAEPNRDSPVPGRLSCPSGRATDGVLVERLGASRNVCMLLPGLVDRLGDAELRA